MLRVSTVEAVSAGCVAVAKPIVKRYCGFCSLLPSFCMHRDHPPESTQARWQSDDGQQFNVFVYGTLRRGEMNDIVLAARRHGIVEPVLKGAARVPGRLFDYGDWPGVLPLAEASDEFAGAIPTVSGDVFTAPIALLAILDEIEGIQQFSRGAFYRELCTVLLASGEAIPCLYYPVDEASTVGCPLIEAGDWIAYRRRKSV